jgi:hypothetical protein
MRALAISLVLSLAIAAPASGDPAADARATAERAADELATRLLRELAGALANGGPEAAIEACAEAAPRLADAVGAAHGVSVRRTSARARNPRNAPDAHEAAWLERADEAVRTGEKPLPSAEVVEAAAGASELRYLRPILFPGAPCAQCHGSADEIAEPVRAAIAKRYPGDAATGFRTGDLRGAFSVRVPLAE